MPKTKYRSSHRSVFNLTVHMVFVTKYRRKVIDAQMLIELKTVFESVFKSLELSVKLSLIQKPIIAI